MLIGTPLTQLLLQCPMGVQAGSKAPAGDGEVEEEEEGAAEGAEGGEEEGGEAGGQQESPSKEGGAEPTEETGALVQKLGWLIRKVS